MSCTLKYELLGCFVSLTNKNHIGINGQLAIAGGDGERNWLAEIWVTSVC